MEMPERSVFPWVVDRSNRTLGWVSGWHRDGEGNQARELSIHLLPAAREALDAPGDGIHLDADLVLSIRRDEIVLDRTTGELRDLIEHREVRLPQA